MQKCVHQVVVATRGPTNRPYFTIDITTAIHRPEVPKLWVLTHYWVTVAIWMSRKTQHFKCCREWNVKFVTHLIIYVLFLIITTNLQGVLVLIHKAHTHNYTTQFTQWYCTNNEFVCSMLMLRKWFSTIKTLKKSNKGFLTKICLIFRKMANIRFFPCSDILGSIDIWKCIIISLIFML